MQFAQFLVLQMIFKIIDLIFYGLHIYFKQLLVRSDEIDPGIGFKAFNWWETSSNKTIIDLSSEEDKTCTFL